MTPAPPRHDPAHDEDTPRVGVVRPYALTSGRTEASLDLPVEALVQALPAARQRAWTGHDQLGSIVAACDPRTSIAELSATVRLPLGVVRVLVSDLVEQGCLEVSSDTLSEATSMSERRALIERTLRGLRAI